MPRKTNPKRKPAKKSPPRKSRKTKSLHPGSSTRDARALGGKGDFGARETDRAQRDYTSRNTKLSDRGAAQPWSHESREGTRVSGAGSRNSGPGSASGGDVDTDITGVGNVGADKPLYRSVVEREAELSSQGADAAGKPEIDDDNASGEARGEDKK